MNKQLVSVAAVAAMAAGGALAVESQNVVGFVSHDIDPNNPVDNVGVCFVPVGNASGNFILADDAFGMSLTSGDTFYVFDADLWDFGSYTYNGQGAGWFIIHADGSSETVQTVSVAPGASLFYMGASETFKMSGQVRASGEQSTTFSPSDVNGYVFAIANPFPVGTSFADLETFCSSGDTLYVFDPSLWDFGSYTYNGVGQGWFAIGADGSSETLTDSSATVLGTGTGASFMPVASCTWTKTVNY